MRKLICVLLTLSLFLASCGESEAAYPEAANAVNSVVDSVNAESRLSGEYMLEISFGEGGVLYYAIGDVAWDRTDQTIFADFDQTYLGISSKMENYYSNGKMVSVEDGSAMTVERDASAYLTKFPYFSVPKPENDSVAVGSNTKGDTYTFKISDSKSLSEALVGDDIYSLVNVIKKPQKELTEYGEASCVYTVSEGKLVSCRYEFDIKLFDTPAYIPGSSQLEEEYTITMHIVARLGYSEFGEDVEIPEYSE